RADCHGPTLSLAGAKPRGRAESSRRADPAGRAPPPPAAPHPPTRPGARAPPRREGAPCSPQAAARDGIGRVRKPIFRLAQFAAKFAREGGRVPLLREIDIDDHVAGDRVVAEYRRLGVMAVEPFAHSRHLRSKIAVADADFGAVEVHA